MNISFENPDKVNGLLTITVEEADFQDSVEKTLKDYRKKANIPGFRPGQAPMGLIKRQFGASVRYDAVNKFVGEQLYKYIQENNIQMLGEPMPSDKQETPADIEQPAPYTFVSDIAVAPELNITLDGRNKIDYYTIKADDKLINEQIEMYQGRAGKYEQAQEYDASLNDLLKGDIRELDADGKLTVREVKSDGIRPEHLEAEVTFSMDDIRVRRVFRVYEGCPAIACDNYVGGISAGKEQSAGNVADNKNIESVSDMRRGQENKARYLERFCPGRRHIRCRVTF